MADTRATADRLPLSALVSQALVAFAIEFDNEFEHRMPHRTTNHGSTPGAQRAPWLVSMAMWMHCMRFVPVEGIPAAELARRAHLGAKSAQMLVKRLSGWWGYLAVGPDPADTRAKPPVSTWLVRPSRAGRQAQQVWAPLTDEVEERWRARFGGDAIDGLREALSAVVGQFDVELPDYPTIGDQARAWRVDTSAKQAATTIDGASELPLVALLSKLLVAFTIDFERRSDLALAVSANVVRALDEHGVRVRDLPALTGIAEMGVDNSLSVLQKRGYVSVGREPGGGRAKLARLTAKGSAAQDAYWQHAGEVELEWQARFGERQLGNLRTTLDVLVGAGVATDSPLFQGLVPYPDGWRAQVREPLTLPHYPMVSHRGGFPDGS